MSARKSSNDYRDAIIAMRVDGKKYREISAELGIANSTVWEVLRTSDLGLVATADNPIRDYAGPCLEPDATVLRREECAASVRRVESIRRRVGEMGVEPCDSSTFAPA